MFWPSSSILHIRPLPSFALLDRVYGRATAEAINPSYVSRVMRLACLAPEITEAILEGKHPAHLTAKELLAPFPLEWAGQHQHFKLS